MTTPKDQEELRALDAWIAEHVFGWSWYSALGDSFLFPLWADGFLTKSHWSQGLNGDKRLNIECHYPDRYAHYALPKYSKDAAQAMLVLEKCAQKLSPDGGGGAIAIEWTGDIEESWRVSETDHHDGISAEAQTLTEAICRFAKALFTQTADKLEGK